MTTVTTKAIAKVAAVATGLAFAASVLSFAPMAQAAALTSAQVQSIISLLQSFGADASTIANVQASLTGGTPSMSMSSGSSSSMSMCTFTRDLTVGSTGADVTCLQGALKAAGYLSVNATGYFGALTKAGVMAWQKAEGITPVSGYFGPKSRAAFSMSSGSTGSSGSTTPSAPSAGTGTGLKVMLSPTSPNGTVLVQGQAIGDLGDFVFANPTSAPITVTALTFNRIGVSNDSTLTNVYLFNAGTRITDSAGVSNSQFSYNNPSGIFVVPAGSTYTVSVRSDIASGSNGQQLGVALVSVASSGTLDPSVSLPVNSGLQTVSAASLAGVDYGTNVTPATTSISPQTAYPVWQDTISVSTNPVKLRSVKFTNLGSIDTSAIGNFVLYVDGTMVGTAQPTMAADRSVTFDLSANPISLSTQSHTIKLLADVTGGASRTIQMSIQRTSDAMFVDQQLGQPVTPTVGGATFTAVSSGTITVNSVSGTSGVSVSLDPGSPNQNVAVGASDVDWGNFDMLASGENVKVSDLFVYATDSIHAGGLANGKVMVNGVQVGSTKNIGTAAADTDFSLGSSLILPSGQTTLVDIYADAKTSTSTNLSNNETVQITIAAGSSNAQGQSSLQSANVPASNTSGNTITIASSALTATKYSGYGNQTIISGSNTSKIGAFTLSSGSTEGVTVNTIQITMSSNNAASITNLTLKDDSTGATLGTVITTPSSSNSFSVNYDIPVSSTKVIDIYGNILSGANAGTIIPSVGTGTTGTGDITGIAASVAGAVSLQNITLGSGSLTVTQGAGDPVSDNVLAGASSVHVGEFQFASANTPYTVENLLILVPNGAATSVNNITLSYQDVNGNMQTVTQALALPSTSQPFATATFTGLTMYVPANSLANLDVYAGTPTIASGATSGTGIQVSLDDGNGSNLFRAVDSSGNSLANFNSNHTNISSNGTHYVRKSIPTFAMIPTGLAVPSTGSPIYKFSITADPAGPVQWTRLVFNIGTTTATVTNVFLTDDSSGNNLLDNNTTSASTTATTITVDLTKNNTQPQFAQIAAGATKTYDLYGTVAGFTTGSTVTLSIASDSSHVANNTAAGVGSNVVWSDDSATNHSLTTTDWTNGFLLKNFTANAVSYSK